MYSPHNARLLPALPLCFSMVQIDKASQKSSLGLKLNHQDLVVILRPAQSQNGSVWDKAQLTVTTKKKTSHQRKNHQQNKLDALISSPSNSACSPAGMVSNPIWDLNKEPISQTESFRLNSKLTLRLLRIWIHLWYAINSALALTMKNRKKKDGDQYFHKNPQLLRTRSKNHLNQKKYYQPKFSYEGSIKILLKQIKMNNQNTKLNIHSMIVRKRWQYNLYHVKYALEQKEKHIRSIFYSWQ